MKAIAWFLLILVLLLGLPLLLPSGGGEQHDRPVPFAPWQIEVGADGSSRAFGLMLGRSRLEDARRLIGADPQVALLIAAGESGSLEAYFDAVQAGPVTGKMVLTLASTHEERQRIQQRSPRVGSTQGKTQRVELSPEDMHQAQQAVIEAIAFIPTANLDEEIVLQRFGPPAERIRSDEEREHFLYPDKGLDVLLDAKGKEVLQYVAPREFSRLREPLRRGK